MKKTFFFLLISLMLVGCNLFEKQVYADVKEQNAFELTADEGSQQPVFGKMAKSAVYAFHANVPWSATVSDSASYWLTISPTYGDTGYHQVTIEVSENDQEQDRVGEITFSGNGFEYVVEVTQTNDTIYTPSDSTYVPYDSTYTPYDSTYIPYDSTYTPYDSTDVPYDSTYVPQDTISGN